MDELNRIITDEMERMYRFAFSEVGDEYLAEDLVQDAILTAYRCYPRLRETDKTRSWLWGILRNHIKRAYRPKREVPTDEIVIIDAAGVSYVTPEDEVLRKADITRVRRAVSTLAKVYRDVCVLYYLEEKDYKTIAEKLDIPLSSVKWRLHESKQQIREEFEKMDYMEKGYRQAVKLGLGMCGWVGNGADSGNWYDGAEKALESLLAKNIAVVAYEKPKTVTEISSEMGVAADYVEEALEALVKTQSLKQTVNRYQTMFPIWTREQADDIYGGNRRMAQTQIAAELLDALYASAEDVKKIGFYGSDRDADKLMLLLIGIVEDGMKHLFDTEKLPIRGIDKAWAFQGLIDGDVSPVQVNGVSSSWGDSGMVEYYFYQRTIPDNRLWREEDHRVLCDIYCGKPVTDEYALSRLLEKGKIEKDGEGYRITSPFLTGEEYGKIQAVLAPVIARADAVQEKIAARSRETVKKHLPAHLADQLDFFGDYCANGILITALFDELTSRGVEIQPEMATWYVK